MRRGPNAGARFLLDTDVTTVGRHPDADIFLDDVTVSRKHAEFVRHRTAFEVRDLNSLNGTYFDGVRIETALSATAPRSRSASTASRSTPPARPLGGRRVTEGAAAARRRCAPPLLGIGQVLAKLNRSSRTDPVEAALPRGAGPGHPVADCGGLPQVLTGRRRPAAPRARDAARPLPPLKVIRAHLDAVDAGETAALPGAVSASTVQATANRFSRDD